MKEKINLDLVALLDIYKLDFLKTLKTKKKKKEVRIYFYECDFVFEKFWQHSK